MSDSSAQQSSDSPDRWDGYVAAIAQVQSSLRAFLRTLLPCPGDADDVLQETNLILWQKRDEYDPTRGMGPWSRRIAYFQVLAFLKARSRSRESPFSDELLEQLAAESEQRVEHIDRRLLALRSCLSKLPSDDQKLVQARYAAGSSVKAMAAEQGRSADALSMHLYRLRQKLAICIDQFVSPDNLQPETEL